MIRYVKHPITSEISKDYKITANGTQIDAYEVRVSAMPYNTGWPGYQRPLDQTEIASAISFESDTETALEVEVAWDFEEAVVRPLSKNVKVQKDGRICRFTLPSCGQYTLEIDGFHKALHIFVDPVTDFAASGNVIRFKAGVHEGDIEIESNTTVILERGAILYGSITAYGAENVNILGYGMIDGSREKRVTGTSLLPFDYYNQLPRDKAAFDAFLDENKVLRGCIRLYRCKNATVKGVSMRDCSTFCIIPADCDNVLIDNVKAVGMWRYNTDGIDIFNSANVVVRNTFLRNFDDCMVIKGMAGWDERNNENILVENCVIWCDWGRSLEIGAETNAPEFRNILFRSCDLIHGSTAYMDIQHHNRADIHRIVFEDIRCEYTKYQLSDVYQRDMNAPYVAPERANHPKLMALPVMCDGRYAKDGKYGRIHDIVFKDIKVYADDPSVVKSVFNGHSEEYNVQNVTVSGFYMNGEKATPVIETNEFVSEVVVE